MPVVRTLQRAPVGCGSRSLQAHRCSQYFGKPKSRQGSVARSTTEAEIISMATGMFGKVLNLEPFLEYLIQKSIEVRFHQDNDAVLKILKNKYSAILRHLNRVHRANVASICEILDDAVISAIYCPSAEQRANGFTKIIPPQEWVLTLKQMQLIE